MPRSRAWRGRRAANRRYTYGYGRAEADIVVDAHLTVVQAHELAVAAEHALIHAVPRLTAATVHTDHAATTSTDPHAALALSVPAERVHG